MLRRGQLHGVTTTALDLEVAMLTEARFAPAAHLPAHAHELPNFLLVVDGSFDESFGRYERTCAPRHLVFRPAGERHAQRFLNRGATCLTIELPASTEDAHLARADGRLRLDGRPALTALRIYDEMRRGGRDAALVLEELVVDLVALAAERPERGAVRPGARRATRPPAWLDVARGAIEARLGQSVRLSEIAAEAGVHRVHLSRAFRQFLGCGVAEYVRRLRVHAACARLRAGGEAASAIAARVGFSDESHMGRAFREVMGATPQAYRVARLG